MSELSDDFDWLADTIEDADQSEEDRKLQRTVLDLMRHYGRRTVPIPSQNSLCRASGLGEANLSRCVNRGCKRRILRWVRTPNGIEVGLFLPRDGFWLDDKGGPLPRRSAAPAWAELIAVIDRYSDIHDRQPELLPVAYAIAPTPTCFTSKSPAQEPSGEPSPACAPSKLSLSHESKSSMSATVNLPVKQVGAALTNSGTKSTDLLFIGGGESRTIQELLGAALRALGPGWEADDHQRNYFAKWFPKPDFDPKAFHAATLWVKDHPAPKGYHPGKHFTKRYQKVRAARREEAAQKQGRLFAAVSPGPAPSPMVDVAHSKATLAQQMAELREVLSIPKAQPGNVEHES